MNKGSCNDLLELRNWLHHTYVHLQSNILCVYATYSMCLLIEPSPAFFWLHVGQNMQYNYTHKSWFMIWNPSWSHQILFWIQAVISLRFVRIDLKKTKGKNDIQYATFAWGDDRAWPGQVLVFTELDWNKLYKWATWECLPWAHADAQVHTLKSLHTFLLGKTIPPLYILPIFCLTTDWQVPK